MNTDYDLFSFFTSFLNSFNRLACIRRVLSTSLVIRAAGAAAVTLILLPDPLMLILGIMNKLA
jgi:hypothetical protein